MNEKKKILLFVVAFPVFFQIITYYGFQSAYDHYSTWQDDFRYRSGIYGYRILSNEGVNSIAHLLKRLMLMDFPFKDYIAQKGTDYYHALFIFNTIFAVFSALASYFILSDKRFYPRLSDKALLTLVLFLAVLQGLSQFVITPYDNLALFLFLCTAYFSLQYRRFFELKDLVFLSLLIFLSTFNRETACLNISFLASLLVGNLKKFGKTEILQCTRILILPVVAFLVAYFLLRIFKGEAAGETYFFESITLKQNFTSPNLILGWLFGLLVLALVYYYAETQKNKTYISRFLLFSSPYIVMLFLVGILWEIRLVVPLIYGAVLLAFYEGTEVVGEKLSLSGKLQGV